MILTKRMMKTFRKNAAIVPQKKEQLYHKVGRSVKRISSFLLDSPTLTNDESWFYLPPTKKSIETIGSSSTMANS